jgi:hypothetical protein
MRFLLTTAPGKDSKQGAAPDPKLMAAIGKLGEEMTRAGVLLESGGLGLQGVSVRLSGGTVAVTDGPFAEAKEVIGGYAIVQVKSQEEAIEMAKRFLEVHRDVLGPSYEAENEVRRLYGPWDFGPQG